MKLAEKNLEQKIMVQDSATPWIHLQDAVSRGTITPLEALDAIEIGYLPENLKVRKSAYSHILWGEHITYPKCHFCNEETEYNDTLKPMFEITKVYYCKKCDRYIFIKLK